MAAATLRELDAKVAPAEERARRARDRLQALRVEEEHLVATRDEAIRQLSELGLSYDEIATTAGVSRARIGQIVASGRGRPAGSDR